MPVTDFPNQSGRSDLEPQASQGFVGYIHPGVIVGGYNYGPTQGMKQSATPSIATSPVRRNIDEDIYEISTSSKSLLQSTFTPTDSRRPLYHVTTDGSSHNRATTILWRFDPGERKVTEVARIKWSTSGKTMVQMSGVHVLVTEFLTKGKWRLGIYSSTQTFTSETEEYMWIPGPTLSNAESCTWQCVIPISRGTTASSTMIAVYRPSFREASQPSQSNWIPKLTKSNSSDPRRPRTPESSFRRPHSRHGSVSGSGKGVRQPAVLQMYPEANSRPRLREIIILTVILVVIQKDEWRNLPPSWPNVTTPDVVLSRLMSGLSGSHGPKLAPLLYAV